MLLKDKVVLITGSTKGIGEGIAKRCLAEGAKIIIHGRKEPRAKELVAEIGKDVPYCIADLMDYKTSDRLIKAALDAYGRLDVLINNAGIYPRSTIDSVTPELYEEVMSTNFRAPLFLTQAAVKVFRQQKTGGNVVNIGSINAYCGESGMSIYAPSKGALMTMTRNLANELGPENIRINLLNVGWTLTPNESALKQSQGFVKDWEKYIPKTYAPSGRLLRPADVAAHAVFWASDQSKPANGVVYDLEQYPMIGRNLINEIPLDVFHEEK